MRKIVIFIFIILLSSLSISCGNNEKTSKVKLEGDLIANLDAQKLYWKYDGLFFNKKYPYYEGDYKFDFVFKSDTSSTDEKLKMRTTFNGEIHDSKVYFDNKMKLNINYYIDYENIEENSKINLVIKSQAILYEGICYYDVKYDYTLKGDKENSTVKSTQKLKLNLEDLLESFELDDLISISSSTPVYAQNNEDFFKPLIYVNSNEKIKFYKGDNVYCYEINEGTDDYLEQYLLRSDEEFNSTYFQSYYYKNTESEDLDDSSITNKSTIEYSYKVQKINKTNIQRPFNYEKYIDGSFSLPI